MSTSSSLYPPSTSSESYPESSLHSLPDKDGDISSFSPHIVTRANSTDFDVDDVSYRLRLLVNNNYFLPPAHSKPSPLSLAPQTAPPIQKDLKLAGSTFLDFFRMGKSKSKPATPTPQSPPAIDQPPPLLRTTSDSTTAGGYIPRSHPTNATQAQPVQAFAPTNSNQTRVVVLRERMDDLMAAAKQAERDIKSRGDGRKAENLTSPSNFDDIIDPTDAVDLPPPSSGYPFAIQASALHGLGPGESLGADLLADCLPPSPGMWSMSTEEESWRKAILHEAVSLSLSDSPDQSFSSMTSSSPDPVSPKSFRAQHDTKPEEPVSSPTPMPGVLIGQRIVEPLKLDSATAQHAQVLSPLSALQPLPSPTSPGPHSPLSIELGASKWRSSLLPPRRAETPASTQPLTPPPRHKELGRAQHSMSSTDLTRPPTVASEDFPTSDPLHVLRRAMSSPRLSAVHDHDWPETGGSTAPESIAQRMLAMSPPTVAVATERLSLSTRPSLGSLLRASPFSEDDDLSWRTPMDDFDSESVPRPSMTLSIPTIGRPSMSEYSNPSPTASAFQDGVFGSCRSPSPLLLRRSHPGSLPPSSPLPSPSPTASSVFFPMAAIPRHLTMSPPPRTSTSLGNTVLPPPPRSPAVKPVYRPTTSSGASTRSTSTHSSMPLYSAVDHDFDVDSDLPQSSTTRLPTVAIAERRGQPSPLSLQIPTQVMSPAIHSAPAPASPTAFFDRIQSHPNAMDDLETSDESDDDDVAPQATPPTPRQPEVFPEPQSRGTSIRSSSSGCSRPSFMRLGNHSSPHLTPSPTHSISFPAFDPDPRKPIGNIHEKGTFFTARSRKKSGKGPSAFPVSSSDVVDAQESSSPGPIGTSTLVRSRSASRRPATSGGAEEKVRGWQRESLQKFDGMLLDHMAAERDTIKRITSNISNSRS